MNFSDVRAKYPAYDDLSDGELADALHKKFYADLDREDFRVKIGFYDTAVFGGEDDPDIGPEDVDFPGVVPESYRLFAGEAGFGDEPISESDTKPFEYDFRTALASALRPETLKRSGVNLGKAVVEPFLKPVETAENIGQLISGLYHKANNRSIAGPYDRAIGYNFKPPATAPVHPDEKVVDAVGDFFAKRYGSWQNIKDTLASDPVAMAADAAGILTLGGAGAATLPAKAGQVGRAIQKTGRAIDPITNTIKAATLPMTVTRAAVPAALGVMSGTGGEAIRQAVKAGGDSMNPRASARSRAKAFRHHMRGKADIADIVTQAENALAVIRKSRNATYRTSMEAIKKNPTIIKFDIIDDALDGARQSAQFKGQGRAKIQPVLDEITQTLDKWKKLDPAEFHTPEGLDFLKKQLGDIRDGLERGSPQELFAGDVYRAIKKTIDNADPAYAKTMKGYSEASELISDIKRSFSLDSKAALDTKLRKLQSLMRDNVTTNYGQRVALARRLEDAGANELFPSVAGQTMSAKAPRGVARIGAQLGTGALVVGGLLDPKLLLALGASSPRLLGEASYLAGKAYGPTLAAARRGKQVGIPAARLGLLYTGNRDSLLLP